MADSPQTLKEFTENVLSDLESGAITTDEALVACGQYTYLREALGAIRSQVSQAELTGDDDVKQLLSSTLSTILTSLSDLPNFQNQSPDRILGEVDIRDRGALRKFSVERVRKSTGPDAPSYKNGRRAFIHDLVTRYSSRERGIDETLMGTAVDQSLAAASDNATSAQTKDRFRDLLIASVEASGQSLTPDQKARFSEDIRASISDNERFYTDSAKNFRRAREIYGTLLDNPDIARPDVFVDIALNARETEPFGDSLLRATKLANVAASLDEHGGSGGTIRFFTADGSKGVVKGLQRGADGLLSALSEPARDMIYHQKVNGVFRSMLSNTQIFADRLGENFVHSSLFTRISQDLGKQLSEKPVSGQARSVFDDVFSSVFRGPLNQPLIRGTEEKILDFFELARANATAPNQRQFLPGGITPWDTFRIHERPGVTGTSVTGIGRFGQWLPGLSLGIGKLGSLFSNLLTTVTDKTTSFFLTNPFIPQQAGASRRAAAVPTQLVDDMPLMVALTVVVVLILLFIFPSPLNLSQLSHSSKTSALMASLVQKVDSLLSSCTNVESVHVYQSDARWKDYSCRNARPEVNPQCTAANTTCKIGPSGCGSASMTMILNAFGASRDVKDVWDEQHSKGGYLYSTLVDPKTGASSPSCLTDNSNSLKVLMDAGLNVQEIGQDELSSVFKSQSTESGDCAKLVLASVQEGWGSSHTGHIIVISGVSGNTATALDPARPENVSSLHIVGAPSSADKDISIQRLWLVTKK